MEKTQNERTEWNIKKRNEMKQNFKSYPLKQALGRQTSIKTHNHHEPPDDSIPSRP